jgi:hypothetical protein
MSIEKITEEADKPFVHTEGHQRFKESVDTTKTPQQEIDEASATPEKSDRTHGTTK